jgi:hypothetical protein
MVDPSFLDKSKSHNFLFITFSYPYPTLVVQGKCSSMPANGLGHRQAGAANNAACKAAVLAQRFAANTAMAGVGQLNVVDEVNAAAMCWPHCINNMEVIDWINCTILASTNMIEEAIRARDTAAARGAAARGAKAAAVAGGTGTARTIHVCLSCFTLYKQCKLAIEISNQISIAHCKRMICMMEEKEAREMEGGNYEMPTCPGDARCQHMTS